MTRRLGAALLLAAMAAGGAWSSNEKRGVLENKALLRGQPTVVVFLSAQCPISNIYGERLQQAYDEFRLRGVSFLFVNSNQNESAAEIEQNAREHGFTFSVFHDVTGQAANQFGAHATPEVFVLDREANVVYHGAVDDAQNPARVHRRGLRDALSQVLKGEPVTVPEIKTLGCSIKRRR